MKETIHGLELIEDFCSSKIEDLEIRKKHCQERTI